ncbi:MAG: hypothetical protein E7Z90_00855 [Cyanobacteria bacterium SIG29]|nr:hypothetical protein [Cyanobacteria bacterium SIG29]
MNKSKLKALFSNMCCSACGHDFEEDSFFIKREEKSLIVLQVVCAECGKSFGLAFLGIGSVDIKDEKPLEFQPCPMPISYDDVLDAHHFIDKLEKDWNKYIPDELKNNL